MPKESKSHKIIIYQNADKHLLLNNLYTITRKQIAGLLETSESGKELSDKDMKRLDLCYDGVRKLIAIEKDIKSDSIGAMPDSDLRALARKALREAKSE